MHYWLSITEDKDLVSLHLTQTCSFPFTITRAPLPWQHVTQSQVHPEQPKPLGKGKVLLSCPCDNLLQGESEECYQGQTLHVPLSFLYLTFLIVTNSKFKGEGATLTVQFSSVTQSCLTLRDPIDYSSQASLPITNCLSLLKLMSIESIMLCNPLILCHLLLLLPSIFPSIRIFSNESVLRIRWPKCTGVSASASVLPMNIQNLFPLGLTGCISLLSKGLSRVFSNTTVQQG